MGNWCTVFMAGRQVPVAKQWWQHSITWQFIECCHHCLATGTWRQPSKLCTSYSSSWNYVLSLSLLFCPCHLFLLCINVASIPLRERRREKYWQQNYDFFNDFHHVTTVKLETIKPNTSQCTIPCSLTDKTATWRAVKTKIISVIQMQKLKLPNI